MRRTHALIVACFTLSSAACQSTAPHAGRDRSARESVPVDGDARLGCLIMAHGFDDAWNTDVARSVSPLTEQDQALFELSFLEDLTGEDDESYVPPQHAYDRLVARGATQIVVMPLFIDSCSNHIDEVRFVAGLGSIDDPEPELVDARIRSADVPIIGLTEAIDGHPLIGASLGPHLLARDDPGLPNSIVLVAHGPNTDREEPHWREGLTRIMDGLAAELPDGFAARTHIMTLRVHDRHRYHERLDECRRTLRDFLARGEVFLVYNHLRSGYMDRMVMRGLPGSEAFPGVLDDLTADESARLRHLTIDICDLGIVPRIVRDRVDGFLQDSR
jgi:hypothetical protein